MIWLVVQHAAVNYPIMGYGSFTPNMPTKLYEDPDNKDYGKYLAMLPRGHIAVVRNKLRLFFEDFDALNSIVQLLKCSYGGLCTEVFIKGVNALDRGFLVVLRRIPQPLMCSLASYA